jgi:hypothetical protein
MITRMTPLRCLTIRRGESEWLLRGSWA